MSTSLIATEAEATIDGAFVIGGKIKISATDPEMRQRLETNYEFCLKVYLAVSAAGIAECIRAMRARNMGTEEELITAFGENLALAIATGESAAPGGMMG